ncbi:hypothetical protein AAE478_006974 [Parahypoxylon ruwenzoriense]
MPLEEDDDLFDDVLNLEEQYYKEGYEQGYSDGAEAGRIEGRSVGLKKGFEKFLEAGRLQGRAIVWANRIPGNLPKQQQQQQLGPGSSQQGPSQQESPSSSNINSKDQDKEDNPPSAPGPCRLPPLSSSNPRLEKNVNMLYGMVEPGTLSTTNDDESVNDFDSRIKGAQSRVKMIERAVGEGSDKGAAGGGDRRPAQKNENIEDIGSIAQRKETAEGKG